MDKDVKRRIRLIDKELKKVKKKYGVDSIEYVCWVIHKDRLRDKYRKQGIIF